jgi:hypothetical protein
MPDIRRLREDRHRRESEPVPAMAQRPPTLADVARLAGVGKATASRVVNDRPDVSAAVRQRVQAAIRRLGFVPDATSRRLAGRRWPGAVAHPRQRARLAYLRITEPEPELAAHARAAAARLGYDLEALAVPPGTLPAMLPVLHQRGVEGLLIRSEEGAFPALPAAWRGRFRVVLLGDHPDPSAPLVACDFARAVHQICRRFSQRRLGFWLIDDGISTAHLGAVGAVLAWARRRPGITLHTGEDPAAAAAWVRAVDPQVLVGPTVPLLRTLAAQGRLDGRRLVSLWGALPGWCADVGFGLESMQEAGLRLLADLLVRHGEVGPPIAQMLLPAMSPDI